jgi:hypothetical protein
VPSSKKHTPGGCSSEAQGRGMVGDEGLIQLRHVDRDGGSAMPRRGPVHDPPEEAGTSSVGSLAPDVVIYFRKQGFDFDRAVEACRGVDRSVPRAESLKTS